MILANTIWTRLSLRLASWVRIVSAALPIRIKQDAKERGLTLRQAALEAATPRPSFLGTAKDVADGFEHWFTFGATDGFIVRGGTPTAFDDFIEQVIPILQQRGLYRTEYEGNTLRENLGLREPENQFAAKTAVRKEKVSA